MDNLFELTVEEGDEGCFAVSFVAEPAIERDFVYMNKAEVKFAAIDEERHLVAGPLLIPDKKILRFDSSLDIKQNNKYSEFLINTEDLGKIILNIFEKSAKSK